MPQLDFERIEMARQVRRDMETTLVELRRLRSVLDRLPALQNQATIMRYLTKVQGSGDGKNGWAAADQQATRAFEALIPIREQVTYATSALAASLQRMPSLDA